MTSIKGLKSENNLITSAPDAKKTTFFSHFEHFIPRITENKSFYGGNFYCIVNLVQNNITFNNAD